MISLFDHYGHKDDGKTASMVNAYARLKNQPYQKRLLEFNNTTVFTYTKEFLAEFDAVRKIMTLGQ